MSLAIKLLSVCVLLHLSCADIKVSLNGDDWKLTTADGRHKDVPATVPGSVHTDLMRAGILKDPYYRMNDDEYRWVGRTAVTYSRNFEVSAGLMSSAAVDLVIGGLDTRAMVFLNGAVVGQSDNMFVRLVLPVKHRLQVGTNTIWVAFDAPVTYAAQQAQKYPYDVPPDCPPAAQHGECHPNFIRKEQCSFSWDWGPSFPTIGIWRNITLQGYNAATVRHVTAATTQSGSLWRVSGNVHLQTERVAGAEINVTVCVKGVNCALRRVKADPERADGELRVPYTLQAPKDVEIERWMPNGYGHQRLYDLEVTLVTGVGDIETKRLRIGFREVELVQQNITGSQGLSFYFKVNGWPIFMKGSNWIPADSFQERITPTYLRRLLTSAKAANMNMLRVWGGGIYESEAFYSLADELGIMIWQDFMFACSLYPVDKPFLSSVEEEIRHQVLRLSHHPSIAIWAGNNENEGAIKENWYKITNYDQYYEDYVKLYIDTVRRLVVEEDTSRPFVPSSPSNGLETQREGWVAKNPQSEYYGDVHHYDYSGDNWDWRIYPRPRFASEFGFESWCSLETLAAAADDDDLSITSNFTAHRQHHTNGNAQMQAEFSKHFDMPYRHPIMARQQFEDFIYLTQINQAMGIKTEAELYRRLQGRLMDGRGHTMGALYWQLNDIWQAPTWASIEYGGKWKMLHYYARRFFSRALLSPAIEGDSVVLYFLDDHMTLPQSEAHKGNTRLHESVEAEVDSTLRFKPYAKKTKRPKKPVAQPPMPNVTVTIDMYSFAEAAPVKTWPLTFYKPLDASTVVFTEKLDKLLSESNCTKDTCFLHFSGYTPSLYIQSNFLLLSYFTNIRAKGLQRPTITLEFVMTIGGRKFMLFVSTPAVAPFVWLEVPGIPGYFSDNGMMLLPGEHMVHFTSWEVTSRAAFKAAFRARSLMDMYMLA